MVNGFDVDSYSGRAIFYKVKAVNENKNTSEIKCLVPVRSKEQKESFVELGGAMSCNEVDAQLKRLVPLQMGDLFLARGREGDLLGWARVRDGGGNGVSIECGGVRSGIDVKIEDFAKQKSEDKRLFVNAWQDEKGEYHIDDLRLEARFRDFAGLEGSLTPLQRGRITSPLDGDVRKGGKRI